jgi:hypothetical protein
MSSIEVDYLGEGPSDDIIARRVIEAVNCRPGTSYRRPLSGSGKSNLDKRLSGLNKGASFRKPLLAIRDLDRDESCAPALVARLLPDKSENMLLRISVNTTESSLMADRAAYAEFCGAPLADIPASPESVQNLKALIQVLGQSGRAKHLRRHLDRGAAIGVPMWGLLGSWHAKFAEDCWDPLRAVKSGAAPSLNRAIERMKKVISDLQST